LWLLALLLLLLLLLEMQVSARGAVNMQMVGRGAATTIAASLVFAGNKHCLPLLCACAMSLLRLLVGRHCIASAMDDWRVNGGCLFED
jgi:hypothetical protein